MIVLQFGSRRALGTLAALGALFFGLTGCKRESANAAPASENVMMIGPENIAVVKATEIRSGPAISGTLAAEQEATVRAEVAGAVLQTYVEPGQRVTKGQVVARIDDTSLRDAMLSARSGMASAQSSFDVAERNLQRAEALVKAGAIADRELEQTRTAHALARSQLADARSRLTTAQQQLAKATVRAPFAGVVSARPVNAGDIVAPGAALVTVMNPATMRLEASVPAEALQDVRIGLPVEFSVNGYPTRRFTGRITRINPVADPATRQVRILASIPNQGNVLVAGLFADGRVASVTRTAPVIPAAAVDERGVRPSVVLIRNGRTVKRDVVLGIRDAETEMVEVASGLQPGDTLLIGQARGITPNTPVRVSAPEAARPATAR